MHIAIAFVCIVHISRWLASVSNHIANRAAHQFVSAFIADNRPFENVCFALRGLAYAHIAIPNPIYSISSCCVGCVFLKICVREATSKILNNFGCGCCCC